MFLSYYYSLNIILIKLKNIQNKKINMKSKKLGRSELLSWINKTAECEYLKVEDLSDGVGFCQIIEAFYKGVSHELNNLKFNAINDIEQKQKNLSIFN